MSTPSTPHWLDRQCTLIGADACTMLQAKTVMVVGLGGVGGHAVEALARTGIGRLILVDMDTVSETNLNRQLLATTETVGMQKALAATARVRAICPSTEVIPLVQAVTPENAMSLLTTYRPDGIIDAIDDVRAKVALAEAAKKADCYLIAAMGTGNKLHPERLQIGDIAKTAYCPLAKAVRSALRKIGINHLPVVWSDEPPAKLGTRTPASISFVPGAAGLLLASAVVNRFLEQAHA